MSSFHSGDPLGTIVVDVGSAATKMGYAGDDYPTSYFRSNVAVCREESKPTMGRISKIHCDYYSKPILPDGTDGSWDCCNPIDMATGLMYDPHLGESGNVVKEVPDWYDLFQKVVDHGFNTAFRGESPKDHPIILAERSYNIPPIRQQMMECLFEELQVPAAFLSKDAVLSCYASGRTNATVIDIGYSGTTVSPVFDGYVEAKGVRRNPAASLLRADGMILEILDKLNAKKTKKPTVLPLYQKRGFAERKQTIHQAARLHMANECRLHGAGASVNTAPATTSTFHAPSLPFELPDGTMVDVPSAERFRVSRVLYGEEQPDQNDAYLTEIKTKVSNYINVASLYEDGDESKQLKNEAVGILERTGHPPKQKSQRRSVGAWQRACNPHLQTLHDQLFTSAPLASMVCDAAYRCERDQQGTLLGNVILSGGGACLGPTEQAVPDAVKESIEALIHAHTPGWRVKVFTPSLSERAALPWIGGSILGSLGSFHDLWISKAEYEEWGSAVVNRKCP